MDKIIWLFRRLIFFDMERYVSDEKQKKKTWREVRNERRRKR